MSKFQFGNVVVVDDDQIGCIVYSWSDDIYEVYVRNYNYVKSYKAEAIQHYVYSKELSDEEKDFYPSRPNAPKERTSILKGLSGVFSETGNGSCRLIFEFDNISYLDSGRDTLRNLILMDATWQTTIDEKIKFINANKEELLAAFVAKTGLQPEECELIIQTRFRDFTENTTAYWVRKRERHWQR